MAMYQTATTANVEFLKSSKGFGGRIIKLNYNAGAIPQQLYGRIDMPAWGAFIGECEALAQRHPYVIKPSAKQVGMWGVCFSIAAVIGCASINPDGGSYSQWEAEVQQMLQRWRPTFQHFGMSLSLQRTREYWVQIDIVGPPPSGPPPSGPPLSGPSKEGFQPGKSEQPHPESQKGGAWDSSQQQAYGQQPQQQGYPQNYQQDYQQNNQQGYPQNNQQGYQQPPAGYQPPHYQPQSY